MTIRFDRAWAMPHRYTFTIGPIAALLREEVGPGEWADPFAGRTSPAQVKNDLDPEAIAEYHLDALEFLCAQESERFAGVLYDPPYSITQAVECYKSYGAEHLKVGPNNMGYWAACKDEVARITAPGGKVICCGWNSNGLGKGRGFRLDRILLVAHGGSKNDTIVTVETKVAEKQMELF